MSALPRYESAPADPAALGRPLEFHFSGRVAPNRLMNAAMSEGLSNFNSDYKQSGIPTPGLIKLYEEWGKGGWGQLVTGNVQTDPAHLEGLANMTVPVDAPFEGERFEAYREMATKAKAHGTLMVAQISNAGRQTAEFINPHPISASDVQLSKHGVAGLTFGKPRAATKEDIKLIIEQFAHAAEYLDRAGFDGVQLHGAHGYLLAQFISPTTNKRTDEYGGSLENRVRIVLEIAAAIKQRCSKEFILGIKVNSVEFQEGGFDSSEAVRLCQALEKAEFDYVETSGGTYEKLGFHHVKESTKKRENFFIEFAADIHKALTKTKVYTTGGFRTVGGMVAALEDVDGVGLGKPACEEPNLANDMLSGKVAGVVKSIIPEDDNIKGLMFAVAQITQMANGEALPSSADPQAVMAVMMKAQKKAEEAAAAMATAKTIPNAAAQL